MLKVGAYTSLGLTGVVFIVHGIVKYGWEAQNGRLPFGLVGAMAGANSLGVVVFVARVSILSPGSILGRGEC